MKDAVRVEIMKVELGLVLGGKPEHETLPFYV